MTTAAAGDVGSGLEDLVPSGYVPGTDAGSSAESAAVQGLSFANTLQVVIAWLIDLEGLGGIEPEMPNPAPLPFILPTVIPGGADNRVSAWEMLDLDVFGSTYSAGADFARQVDYRMRQLRNQVVTVGGWPVPIGEIRCVRRFGYSNYSDDPLLWRFIGTYEIESRYDAQPI